MNSFPVNYQKEREVDQHDMFTQEINALITKTKYNYPQEAVRYERNVSFSFFFVIFNR